MLFCTNCGDEVSQYDTFCRKCGSKVTQLDDNTKKDLPLTDKKKEKMLKITKREKKYLIIFSVIVGLFFIWVGFSFIEIQPLIERGPSRERLDRIIKSAKRHQWR